MIQEERNRVFPDPYAPPRLGIMRSHVQVITWTCGRKYQEGFAQMTESDSLRMCRCGTYSIGRCKRCDAEVCDDHSDLLADLWRLRLVQERC